MPQIKSNKHPHSKSVHWDENVDLRSPDSKRSTKVKTNFNLDHDPDDGLGVIGFRKQIKTSNDKKIDRKTQAKKKKVVKKKKPPIQWQAKPKETTPPKENTQKIHELIPPSPVPNFVPPVEEDEDSDFSLTDDLQQLLNSSPRKDKHINKRILKDLEELNSLSFSSNPKSLHSSRSLGDTRNKTSPRNLKSSFSSNDLRLGLHSRRSLKSGDRTPPLRHGWKKDFPDSSEFELEDPPSFRQEVYERDRFTYITSDYPDEDVSFGQPFSSRSQPRSRKSPKKPGKDRDIAGDLSSDSIPSPNDLLSNRDFLFSPDITEPVKSKKNLDDTLLDTPRTRAYKLTTRSTPVSRADEKITTDRPNPYSTPTQPPVKPPVKKIVTNLPKAPLTVGESPTEVKKPDILEAKTKKGIEKPKIIKPVLPSYGSADLKDPKSILESPKDETDTEATSEVTPPIIPVNEQIKQNPTKPAYPLVPRFRPNSKTPQATPRPTKPVKSPQPAKNLGTPKPASSPIVTQKAQTPTSELTNSPSKEIKTGNPSPNVENKPPPVPLIKEEEGTFVKSPGKPQKETNSIPVPRKSEQCPVPQDRNSSEISKETPNAPTASNFSPGTSPRSKVKSQTPNKAKKPPAAQVSSSHLKVEQPFPDNDSPWGTPRVRVVPDVSNTPTQLKQKQPEVVPKPGGLSPTQKVQSQRLPEPRKDSQKPASPSSLKTEPVFIHPQVSTDQTERNAPSIPSLRRLAFNKLRSDFDEKKINPGESHNHRVPQHPQPGHQTHAPSYPAQERDQRFEDIEHINASPWPQEQPNDSFPESSQNPPFFVQGQPLGFPHILRFPYPDVALAADPESSGGPFSGNPGDEPLQQSLFHRVIILGHSDQGAETLLHGIPPQVLSNFPSQGPVITELDPSEESNNTKPRSDSPSSSLSNHSNPDPSRKSQDSSEESETSPTQFVKNIKRIGKTKRESNFGMDQTSSGESGSEQNPPPVSERRRRSGAVNQLPSYFNPAGTQYVMRSKSTSRETSAGTSMSSHNAAGIPKKEKLETIKSARDPHDFDPDDIPDFDDSDIESEYEGKDIYVCYLKTDDGEIIGPLRLDIEDIEMGLPGQENDKTKVNLDPEGMRNRHSGSHGLNEFSSRSHSMLTVTIDTESQDPEDENLYITKRGKLTFVDLAGSEKVRDTGSKGETLTETNSINKSLLILGNCISHLGDSKRRQGHIPYRDSKLTKLLADSLGGNGVTLMIACITPSSHNSMETLNTLRYANRAKKIKTKPVVKMDPREKLIMSLKREIKILRNENHYLRQQMDFPAKPKGQLQKENDEKFMTFMKEQQRKESGLYEMLQEYMVENEALRSENSDHHSVRDKYRREQQELSRENEKLMKRVEELERMAFSPPQTRQQTQSRHPSQVESIPRGSPKLHHPYPASGQQYPIPVDHQGYQGQGYPIQGHPSQGYPVQGHPGSQGSRGIPARLPPQDLPKPDPAQINNIPNNRVRPAPPPGGAAHPSRPPHRLSDSIIRTSQGQFDPAQNGGYPERTQQSPRTRQRQVSPNRGGLDRKVSQGSNSDAIHGMNARLKSELLELEGEIANQERYAQRRYEGFYR